MKAFFEKIFSINFKELNFETQEIVDMLTTALNELFAYVSEKIGL